MADSKKAIALGQIKVPIHYHVPDDLRPYPATMLVIEIDEDLVKLAFYDARQPMYSGDEDRKVEESKPMGERKPIVATCVARIAIAPHKLTTWAKKMIETNGFISEMKKEIRKKTAKEKSSK